MFISNCRTPFETSSLSNAFSAVLQFVCSPNGVAVYYTVNSIFIEFALYTKAFIFDIRSMFERLDQLAKNKKKSVSMHECCKEAVDLHEKVLR